MMGIVLVDDGDSVRIDDGDSVSNDGDSVRHR